MLKLPRFPIMRGMPPERRRQSRPRSAAPAVVAQREPLRTRRSGGYAASAAYAQVLRDFHSYLLRPDLLHAFLLC
jgi:hypothetical protein